MDEYLPQIISLDYTGYYVSAPFHTDQIHKTAQEAIEAVEGFSETEFLYHNGSLHRKKLAKFYIGDYESEMECYLIGLTEQELKRFNGVIEAIEEYITLLLD